MKLEGGCYCGALRYVAEGDADVEGAVPLPANANISRGGAPNMFVVMPPDGFVYTKGAPKHFQRSDLEKPVTREFCAECGTHLATRRPGLPAVILKVGTLDDPALFEAPQMAIFTSTNSPSITSPRACRLSSACRSDERARQCLETTKKTWMR